MDLSVIIVNYNVRHFLEQCLYSVMKASENIDCEIFVVDNNSADGSCSMVKSLFPSVRLIMNRHNAGYSAANNQAIKISKGTYILLLNPDTIVEEDTFRRCFAFMNAHRDAGALGVKMINGNGKLLPESKRALPTPRTAFFKMSGLSVLFPKSPLINRYYLGNLNHSETCEAEILTGAFMFIRKEALAKTGLLDEAFFMYGEDIDLSYRIIKAGFKNYYFPEVKIVHYKGESTRKGNISYIVHFYKAMIIFVRKHFMDRRHSLFFLLIWSAVYFWGISAIIKNFLKKYFLQIADSLQFFSLFYFMVRIWEDWRFPEGYHYPEAVHLVFVSTYTLITVICIYLTGGYRLPSKLTDTIKGISFAIVTMLGIYSLMPLNLRYSRAVMLLGGVTALTIIPLYRFVVALTGSGLIENPFKKIKRILIVSDSEGFKNISSIIIDSPDRSEIIGRVSVNQDDLGTSVLGDIEQIEEILRINRINEIIFSTRHLTASKIINYMDILSGKNINIRIAPSGEKLIIGSKSINLKKSLLTTGDFGV